MAGRPAAGGRDVGEHAGPRVRVVDERHGEAQPVDHAGETSAIARPSRRCGDPRPPPNVEAEVIAERFADVVDRLKFTVPFVDDPDTWAGVLADIVAAGGRSA